MRKILLTTAAAGLAATPALAEISDGKVKIGILNDQSGVYADFGGKNSVEAAKMAVEDFGGKVLDAPIEIVSADHQNKPDIASNIARQWYDTEQVDSIMELTTSSVGLAVQALSQEKKKVTINTGAATTELTGKACTPYGFHWAYDTHMLAVGTGGALVKAGGDSWFFLTADYAFGHSLEKDTADVVKANGGKVLGAVRHPLNASDFSSFLLQAQASKAKIVGLANAGGDTINSIKAANEFGLTKNQKLVGLLTQITDIHALGLPTTQGMMFTEGFYWNLNAETRDWSRRYFAKMKKMPSMLQAGVYSAVLTYLKAVQAAGTDEADAVMKQLKSMTINDMFAKNGKIREDGRMVHDMFLVEVKKQAESKEPWDYYHVRSVIPGSEAFQPLSLSRCPLVKK